MNAPANPLAADASPVMAQFFDAKARQPDALVFFRMGDFYELFFDDAIRAAAALGIAQTFRGTHNGQPIPMAGVPVVTLDGYLAKLVRKGESVAICEQRGEPGKLKGPMEREVVRIVTPGTLTDEALLDERRDNLLRSGLYQGQSQRAPGDRPKHGGWRFHASDLSTRGRIDPKTTGVVRRPCHSRDRPI